MIEFDWIDKETGEPSVTGRSPVGWPHKMRLEEFERSKNSWLGESNSNFERWCFIYRVLSDD